MCEPLWSTMAASWPISVLTTGQNVTCHNESANMAPATRQEYHVVIQLQIVSTCLLIDFIYLFIIIVCLFECLFL